jgi:hypothetical protein
MRFGRRNKIEINKIIIGYMGKWLQKFVKRPLQSVFRHWYLLKGFLGYKKFIVFVILFVIGLAIFPYEVLAQVADRNQGILMNMIGSIIQVLVTFLGGILVMLINFVSFIFEYNNFLNSAVVRVGWPLVRDLCNMFFVVGLLLISFGTILNIQEYHFKSTLPKLLLAAILVNFSKTILGFCIDFSQVIMLTFVNSFKDALAINLTNSFGLTSLLNFNRAFDDKVNDWSILVTLLTAVMILVVAIGIMLAYVVVLLWRIVTLWTLIVLSPLAFLLGAIPGAAATKAGEFWSKFWSQLTTGVILAFFMWLVLAVLANISQEADASLSQQLLNPKTISGSAITGVLGDSNTTAGAKVNYANDSWQMVYGFLVAVALLMLALTYAQQAGGLAGDFAGKVSGTLGSIGRGVVSKPLKGALATGKFAGESLTDKIQEKTGWLDLNVPRAYKRWKEGHDQYKKKQYLRGLKSGDEAMTRGNWLTARMGALAAGGKDIYGEKGLGGSIMAFFRPMGKAGQENADKKREELKKAEQDAMGKEELAKHHGLGDEDELKKIHEKYDKRKIEVEAEVEAKVAVELEGLKETLAAAEATKADIIGKRGRGEATADDDENETILTAQIAQLTQKKKDLETPDELKNRKEAAKSEVEELRAADLKRVRKSAPDDVEAKTDRQAYAQARIKEQQNIIKDRKDQLQGKKTLTDEQSSRLSDLRAKVKAKVPLEALEQKDLADLEDKESLKDIVDEDARKLKKKKLEKIVQDAQREVAYYTLAQNEDAEFDPKKIDKYAAVVKKAKKKLDTARHASASATPLSNFELRDEIRKLEHEEMDKLKGKDDESELIEIANEAIETGNQARLAAVLKKLAKDGNDNEILNAFGYSSDFEGMRSFYEKIVRDKAGFSDQDMHRLANEVSYINESIGHYETSRVNIMEHGRFRWQSQEEHANVAGTEILKKDVATIFGKYNRLLWGGHDADGTFKPDQDLLNKILRATANDLLVSPKLINEKMTSSWAYFLQQAETDFDAIEKALGHLTMVDSGKVYGEDANAVYRASDCLRVLIDAKNHSTGTKGRINALKTTVTDDKKVTSIITSDGGFIVGKEPVGDDKKKSRKMKLAA